jgi:hypothetical protein
MMRIKLDQWNGDQQKYILIIYLQFTPLNRSANKDYTECCHLNAGIRKKYGYLNLVFICQYPYKNLLLPVGVVRLGVVDIGSTTKITK